MLTKVQIRSNLTKHPTWITKPTELPFFQMLEEIYAENPLLLSQDRVVISFYTQSTEYEPKTGEQRFVQDISSETGQPTTYHFRTEITVENKVLHIGGNHD